jgi:DNA-binding HxlR family transcriptional regulator
MRSYGQYCAVAKALDVVGDRWTMLIIRELVIQGPCRYTDLQHGLPGIATNLLADRLRELEDAGLVRRQAAPPPVATTLFHLTDDGLELGPVLDELGRWGTRFMADPSGDEADFRSHWLAFPVAEFLHDRDPAGAPVAIELRTGDQPAVIEAAGGEIRVRLGAAAAPDLVLDGAPRVILGVLTRQITMAEARRMGLRTSGDPKALRRLQPGAGPRAAAPSA